ncbi:MAG: hypothetical protein ACT4PL_02395 [Phycisphaerales bacterium]
MSAAATCSKHLFVLLALTAAGGSIGCAGPGLKAGFDAPDPSARLHATVEAARTNDRSKAREVVRGLESDDPAERMLSILTLERLTGDTLGYGFADDRAARMGPTEAWKQRYGLEPDDGR